jgi:hypothetical protein
MPHHVRKKTSTKHKLSIQEKMNTVNKMDATQMYPAYLLPPPPQKKERKNE